MEKRDELLLPSAAAQVLGCSVAAIRLWARRGELPSVPLSGGWRGWRAFRREDLDHFAAARANRRGARRDDD